MVLGSSPRVYHRQVSSIVVIELFRGQQAAYILICIYEREVVSSTSLIFCTRAITLKGLGIKLTSEFSTP